MSGVLGFQATRVPLRLQVVSEKGSLSSLVFIMWSMDQRHQHHWEPVGDVGPQAHPVLLNQNLYLHKLTSDSSAH